MQRTVCPSGPHQVNPADVLSDLEVRQLMQSFTRGKAEILEDDALLVLRWAQEQRWRGLLLDWVLDGSIQPHVIDGEVRLALPSTAQQ